MPQGPKNPHNNGFIAQETDLTTTTEAQRLVKPESARIWKIKNPAIKNPMSGSPVAYKLMPMSTPTLLANPDSVVAKRAVFASKNLWVTPYSDNQKFPAGEYVLMADVCQGLKVWTQEVRHTLPLQNVCCIMYPPSVQLVCGACMQRSTC